MHRASVVQFEITGKDSVALKRFYALLFGWQIQEAKTTPGYYLVPANDNGIQGGIGNSWDSGSGHATFYVEVDDLPEHLSYAEELGGTIIGPPHEVTYPGGHSTFAFFADPEGNVVGLSESPR